MRISRLRIARTLRTWSLYVFVGGLGLAGLYAMFSDSALSPLSHSSAYRDITWEDLLEHPSKSSAAMSPGGKPTSLSSDPWANLSDEVESAIQKSATKSTKDIPRAHFNLNGADVRLAGYIVPLDDSPENLVTEFFLVPYVGACIHVPPPPPNQIVYIKFPLGLRVSNIYQAFQIEGTLHTQTMHTGLADTSYMMVADEVVPYDPQAAQ